MKKIILLICYLSFNLGVLMAQEKTLYDFKATDVAGEAYDLSKLKGKKVLLVNTASECGFTPQYSVLEELYQEYKEKDFIILAFPANNFGAQEPGSNEEIANFCKKNYGVSFPVMSKISVKGEDIDPLFLWLTKKVGAEVTWNFQKFMIDENGQYIGTVTPQKSPADEQILNWIN